MKFFTSLCLALATLVSFAQAQNSFTDDFESYTAGALLAQSSPQWATWTGQAGGGANDAAVSNALAHSGSNSLYLASTSTTGGPSDIVLPFNQVMSSGSFTYEMWMYVNNGKTAYFNYQGSQTMGQVYTMNVNFTGGDTLWVDDGSTYIFQTMYPQGQWFDFKMTANLNNATWQIWINNVLMGSFSDQHFGIAAMDFYPVMNSQFYMDDVSYNYVPYTQPLFDAAVAGLTIQNGLTGQQRVPSVTVRNLGINAITSFNLTVNYNGVQSTQNITGVNYASGSANGITLTQPVALAAGSVTAIAIVSNVNGGNDNDATDDTARTTVTAITPATGKVVVAEEGTGTWCQWCPRGAVYMDMMSEKYGNYFAGIAVHNSDPMTVTAYDASMGQLITGYPSVLVDRGAAIDPSGIEQPFMNRIVVAPKVLLSNIAHFDASSRELTVSVTSHWQAAVNGNDYKLVCVLTEDSVHSTGSGWSQSNAYSGGASGVMGGFELLGNPVPASQMYYSHVARAISPGWDGAAVYNSAVSAGDVMSNDFTFTLPTTWNENRMHIVSFVVYKNGAVTYTDNAGNTTFAQAIANGTPNAKLGIAEIFLFPNPSTDQSFVNLNLTQASNVVVSIYDVTGKLLQTKNYGMLTGGNNLPIATRQLASGVYMVNVNIDGKQQTLKLVKS